MGRIFNFPLPLELEESHLGVIKEILISPKRRVCGSASTKGFSNISMARKEKEQ
jgi:hypothetical protein